MQNGNIPTPQEVLQTAEMPAPSVSANNPTPEPAAPDVQAPPQSSADLLAGLPGAKIDFGAQPPAAAPTNAAPIAPAPDSPASVPGSFASKLATALKVAHSVLSGGAPAAQAAPAQPAGNLQPTQVPPTPKPTGLHRLFPTSTEELSRRAAIAHEQIETLYQSRVTDQLGEKAEQENVEMGKKLFDASTTGQYGAPVLKEGITGAEAQRLIKESHLDPTDIHAYPTGIIENADGSKQTTWSVVGDVPAQAMQPDAAKLINQYVPNSHPPGQPWSEDPDKPQPPMPGYQLHSLYQQAMSNKTVLDAANAARTEADLKVLTDQQKLAQTKAVSTLNANTAWMKALSAFGGQEDLAANWISGNGKLPNGQADPSSVQAAKDNPNVMQTIADAHGGVADWAKVVRDSQQMRLTQQADAVKKMEEIDPLFKIERDPAEYSGDKGPATQAQLEGMLNDPNTPANQVGRIQHLLGVVKSSIQTEQTLKTAQQRAEQAAKDGNPQDAATLLYHGLVAPSEIISARDPKFAQETFSAAAAMAQKDGSSWSPAMAEAQYKHATSQQTQNTLDMIRTINEPGGDMDILRQSAAALPGLNQETTNKIFNITRSEFGNPAVSNFQNALINLATAAATAQMGGGVPSQSLIEDQINALRPYFSKGKLADGMNILSKDIANRGRAIIGFNPTLRSAYPDIYQQTVLPSIVPVPAGMTRLTDGKGNNYDVPAANAAAAMKQHPELKAAQ